VNRRTYSPDHLSFEGFAQGVEVDGTVVVSGQVAIGPDGQLVGPGDPAAQAEQCFRNLTDVLSGFGLRLDSVMRINCYLTDRAHYPAYAAAKKKFLAGIDAAGTAVIADLLDERFLLEVEAIASGAHR
jgi:enamine deaminase RidA (YjgF/YER057c/UK114 family)